MASLINQAFQNAKNENRPALLTYTVAGDNTKKKSLEILKSISNYADICELGFPHNTPIADGGQIQTSAYRAIKNGIKTAAEKLGKQESTLTNLLNKVQTIAEKIQKNTVYFNDKTSNKLVPIKAECQ